MEDKYIKCFECDYESCETHPNQYICGNALVVIMICFICLINN